MENNGIVMHGGSLHAGNIVVGKSAHLTVTAQNITSETHRELISRLNLLVSEVEKIQATTDEYKQLVDAAHKAKEEGSKVKPSRDELEANLSVVEKAASTFSVITNTIVAVRSAFGAFFGI